MKPKIRIQRLLRQVIVLTAFVVSGTAYAGSSGQSDLEGPTSFISPKEGKIIEIMDDISNNTPYVFIYEDGVKQELNKKVKIGHGKNLQDVLSEISKQSGLEFRTVNNNVIVRKRAANQSRIDNMKSFRSIRVTGQVTSSDEESGLPGVSILEKGTTNGTVTDAEGNYALDVAGEASVLVFSSIGYLREEITVGSQTVIDIQMVADITSLEEVVVTALGIEREQRSLGYSVGQVKGKELTEVSQENVLNSLAGRVPGVTINQTSGPGSTVSVIIRGMTSLSTDNQPLFVVDGVPMSNSMNNISENGSRNQVDYGNAISDINPDDIESVSVLKGPSAAALYGSRAGNGVILITTKSGKGKRKLGVSVSTNNVFERPVKLLDFHYRYGSGQRNPVLDEGSAYWGGPQLDVGNRAVQWNSPLDANGVPTPTELVSYPDNMKEFLQTGITSNNNIALTGGNEKVDFRVSYSNMLHRGMIPNSDLFRHSFSTRVNYEIVKGLTFSSNVNVGRTFSNDRPNTGNRGANALQAVYTWPHVNVLDMRDYWVEGSENIRQNRPSNEGNNPYFIAYGITNEFTRDRIYGNLKLNWEITPELSVMVRTNLDRSNENRETKIPFDYSRQPNGGYYLSDQVFQEMNSDFLATYNNKFNKFDVSVSVGGNYMRQDRSNNWIGSTNRRVGLVVPGLFNVGNINRENLGVENFLRERAIYSLYGLASIGYNDMLYLDITGRNDWSSTLRSDNNSYFYPSASLSWLANYTFDMPEVISMLKFRAGWAQVGNDTDPYRLDQVLRTGNFNDLTTVNLPPSLLNPQLLPETATSIEFGIDYTMFNNRLRFNGTYYQMENKDQVLSIPLPQSSGFNSRDINAGSIESRGWEISLGGTPIRQEGGLMWDITFNYTYNRTELKELVDGVDFIDLWQDNNGGAFTFVGDEIGDLYSAGYARVMDPNSPYYQWPILSNNGAWQELPSDRENRIKVGNFNPDFILGMQTSFNYKNFTLSASFDWRQGGEFQSYTYRYGESDWKSQRQIDNLIPGGLYSEDELVDMLKSNPDEYIIPGNGNYPRVGGHTQETGGFFYDDEGNAVAGNDGAYIPGVIQVAGADTPDDFSDDVYTEHLAPSDATIYPITSTFPWDFNQAITFDASFIKLRELTLAYRLPKFAGLQSATFAIYTRNIMLWNAAKIGVDPERAFEANNGEQGDTRMQFRQGLERQNIMPWTVPIGFKLNLEF